MTTPAPSGHVPAWYDRYLRACNRRDWPAVRNAVAETVTVNGLARTRAEYVADLESLIASFPDFRWEVREVIQTGDRLVVRLRDQGTRHGPFLDAPADGARVETEEIAIYRRESGLIREVRSVADDHRLARIGPGGPHPVGRLTQLVLECADPLTLAGFWREILDLDPPVEDGDWVTLTWEPVGRLSFHAVPDYRPPVWPGTTGEVQTHLDLLVEDLPEAERRILAAGARPLSEVQRPGPSAWRVYADPEGHPFCLVSTPE